MSTQGEPVAEVVHTAAAIAGFGCKAAQLLIDLPVGTKLYTAAPTIPAGYLSVSVDLLKRVEKSLGAFCSDEGWGQSDMDVMDSVSAVLAVAPKGEQP